MASAAFGARPQVFAAKFIYPSQERTTRILPTRSPFGFTID